MSDEIKGNEEVTEVVEQQPTADLLAAEYDHEVPTEVTPEPEAKGDDNPAKKTPATDSEEKNSEPAQEQPKFDERLLAHAAYYGIPKEMAEGFSSPQDLARVLFLHERQLLRGAVPVATPEKTDGPKGEPSALQKALEALEQDEGYDPNLKVAIQELAREKEQIAQVLALQLEADARRQAHEQERAVEQETALWDNLFNGVEMEDVFGKGTYTTMKRDSAEFKNRERVIQRVNAEAQLASMRGEHVSERDLLLRAAQAEFPDRAQKQQTQKLTERLRDRSGQFVSRPSMEKSKAKDPRSAAIEAVAEHMRANGLNPDMEDDPAAMEF